MTENRLHDAVNALDKQVRSLTQDNSDLGYVGTVMPLAQALFVIGRLISNHKLADSRYLIPVSGCLTAIAGGLCLYSQKIPQAWEEPAQSDTLIQPTDLTQE